MRRVLHPIRIDRSHKGWISEPCKPKRREESHTNVKHGNWMHGKMRKTCIIGALLWRDVSWSWTEGMWVCWHGCVAVIQSSWSYKAKGYWSRLAHQLACYHPTNYPNTHYVSCQQPYLWMLHGAPDFSSRCLLPFAYKRWAALPVEPTGKASSRLCLTSLIGVLIVGGFGTDVRQLVSSLTGGRGGVTQGVNWEFIKSF